MAPRLLSRLAVLAALLISLTLIPLVNHYANLPGRVGLQETLLLGQTRLVPGSPAALRVFVRDRRDFAPVPDAAVTVALRPAAGGRAVLLFQGTTDADGNAAVNFTVPDGAAEHTLVVTTRSRIGQDRIERPVTLARDYRILLTSDKPLYQPGQIIHLRVLALGTLDLRPAAGQTVELSISDGKGNRVYRDSLTTGDYGQADADFQLATEVNTGPYKITVQLGNTSWEKTVTVERYQLPKFDVNLATERSYYRPGEHVRGTVQAGYFFGKPVAGGSVQLEGFTVDVERAGVFTLQGTADADGRYTFEFDLPAYLAGSDLDGGLARFYLQASVTDRAQHRETSSLSFPVASQALVIDAIPEGGRFRPGVENILYVLTSYPDGTPVATSLSLQFEGRVLALATGPYGLAEFRVTPPAQAQPFTISAQAANGASATRTFAYASDWSRETVLLRPARPVYRVGETLTMTVLTSQPSGTVYLDIVRAGQTLSTRSISVHDGRAEVGIDLGPDFFGTLELHAYKILNWGAIARDTRLVVVDAAEDLLVDVRGDREIYRPGDTAELDVHVTGADGAGAQSAVGLAIVDESVFALAEQDPGFAKLYFLLESQLLLPKYDLHGFSVPQLLTTEPAGDPDLRAAQEGAARAALAAAAPTGGTIPLAASLAASSYEDALKAAMAQQQTFFHRLAAGGMAVALLAAFAAFGVSAHAVSRRGALREAAAWALTLLILTVVTVAALLVLVIAIERSVLALFVALMLVLALPAGLIVLAGRAWRADRPALLWAVALTVIAIASLALAVYGFAYDPRSGPQWLTPAGVLVLLLVPASYLLWAGEQAARGRALPAGLLITFVVALVAGPIPLLTFSAGRAPAAAPPLWLDPAHGRPEFFMAAAPLRMASAGWAPEKSVVALTNVAAPEGATQPAPAEPPRLRQFFPETMFWLPDAVTRPDGTLHLDVPVADSITTWRISALASTQDGRLGSTTAGLRVFQDFFVDLDLPLALTVGDEIAVPVGVFNYLPEGQSVRLELAPEEWFELLDAPVQELAIAANDIQVVYFRVRARDFGLHPFRVTAYGSRESDAIQKEVRVYPNGKEQRFSFSDRLPAGSIVTQPVTIPADAVPGTAALTVKVYPGLLSQVVEGLDAILRMPSGCFEQTSSTTYPNVLVLDYLRATEQASPEIELMAEEYINLGYQRLTTFEVQGGGFSLFGQPPADRMLTAYGLQEFADMARVADVDPAILQRAATWLLGQQAPDGSWANDQGLHHEGTWHQLANDRLPVTAYVVWSLSDAGFAADAGTQRGSAYLRTNLSAATDPYVVALVANALVAEDLARGTALSGDTRAILDRLASLAELGNGGASWKSAVATFMGSQGQTGSIETTALAALAFLRADERADLANAALTTLVREKDGFGTWHSTQATVLALKALIASARGGAAERADASVTITVGGQTRRLDVTPDNFDVVQMVTFEQLAPGAAPVVTLQATGDANLMYQIAGRYYLPWRALPEVPEEAESVAIDVRYERAELAVNDLVTVAVTVRMNAPGRAESALIDLGVPPGFAVQAEDFEALVARDRERPPEAGGARIERFELTGRQVLIYVRNLSSTEPLTFSYRLKARFPVVAQTPASTAYDYYNPERLGEVAPQLLIVR